MSTVNYTIVAFDDMTLEYVVTFDGQRILVPAVVVDGVVDENKTKDSIGASIRQHLNVPSVDVPSDYVSLIGTTETIKTTAEEV